MSGRSGVALRGRDYIDCSFIVVLVLTSFLLAVLYLHLAAFAAVIRGGGWVVCVCFVFVCAFDAIWIRLMCFFWEYNVMQ